MESSTMSQPIEGGCQCGAARYEATAKPVSAIHCYCRQCQHITGAGHASQFALPSGSVTVHGKVSRYEMKGRERQLCNECILPGLRQPQQSEGYPQFKSFHAATLDDPSLFEPQRSVWTSQRPRWDMIDETLPAK
jgi:hypothetical protein